MPLKTWLQGMRGIVGGRSFCNDTELLVHLFLPDCCPHMEFPLADAFQLPFPEKMNCRKMMCSSLQPYIFALGAHCR